MTDVVERFPAARAAGRRRERGLGGHPALDLPGIAEQQRGVERGAGDARMECEQALGAVAAAAGRRFDELLHGGADRQRPLLDPLAQRVPRVEPVLARDNRLRVVQRQRRPREIGVRNPGEGGKNAKPREGGRVAVARGLQQILGLPLELLQIGALG